MWYEGLAEGFDIDHIDGDSLNNLPSNLQAISRKENLSKRKKTQKEISKMYNISRSYVSRIEKRALTKLLREFVKNKNFEKILLASQEKIVYACLSLRPKHIEELMEETGISLQELTNLLFDMEMKHYIKQPLKNYFIIQS